MKNVGISIDSEEKRITSYAIAVLSPVMAAIISCYIMSLEQVKSFMMSAEFLPKTTYLSFIVIAAVTLVLSILFYYIGFSALKYLKKRNDELDVNEYNNSVFPRAEESKNVLHATMVTDKAWEKGDEKIEPEAEIFIIEEDPKNEELKINQAEAEIFDEDEVAGEDILNAILKEKTSEDQEGETEFKETDLLSENLVGQLDRNILEVKAKLGKETEKETIEDILRLIRSEIDNRDHEMSLLLRSFTEKIETLDKLCGEILNEMDIFAKRIKTDIVKTIQGFSCEKVNLETDQEIKKNIESLDCLDEKMHCILERLRTEKGGNGASPGAM